jgi:hypothetical protein
MTDESGRMRKEVVVACFKVLSLNFPDGTEKTAINLSQGRR